MTATALDIQGWLLKAEQQGARWLIIACDEFDNDNYPMFCKTEEEFKEAFKQANNYDNMQHIDEIYDMSLDRQMQLAEHRAYHPPKMDK